MRMFVLTSLVVGFVLLAWHLTRRHSVSAKTKERLELRRNQSVARSDEDLLQRLRAEPCRVQYGDGKRYLYCYKEIDAAVSSLPQGGGPWTADKLVAEHFRHFGSCERLSRPASEESLLYEELRSRECREIIQGRLLLIASSFRPEVGWFLGNELMRRTLAGAGAAVAITTYYSEFGSCCEDSPEECPVSAGSTECFSDYPAYKWWEAHRAALLEYESWRARLLQDAGLTVSQYHLNGKSPEVATSGR